METEYSEVLHTVQEFVLSEFTQVCLNSQGIPFALRVFVYLYSCYC
jgi:hypothetical protein